jgi:hypothetical protein
VGVAAGAVEKQDGVVDVTGGVAVRRAEGEVVELELGKGFAGAEVEVVGDVVAGCAGVGGRCGGVAGADMVWAVEFAGTVAVRRAARRIGFSMGGSEGYAALRALAKYRGLSTSLRSGRDDESIAAFGRDDEL